MNRTRIRDVQREQSRKLLSFQHQSLTMSELTRQLATIMFSDIVGYSRMMNQDERKAIRLRKEVEKILKNLTPRYDGQIIQFYGDGALTMFDSNVEAVQCAFLIQKAIHQLQGVQVRIGIHVGDVALEGEQIYGECVNIASRIESFCTPGAVMFSDRVYEGLRNQVDLNCLDLGQFQLKNIQRPIRLYALSHEEITVPIASELRGKGERSQKSIAVLPFVNMSADPENEYFSDGISEELLNALSKEDELRVTARTSSFAYKGSHQDIREIGSLLNVEYVLEGSVRKVGNRVRITAQLIKANEGFHVLSETYDRTLDNIFEVQDEIALQITNQLRQTLGLDDHSEVIHDEPTKNFEAYQDYLKGIFHWNKYDPENAQKAIFFLKEATLKDPFFAEAYAFASFCYSFLGGTSQMEQSVAFPLAKETADKAIALNSKLPESHCANGLVLLFQKWDLVKAEEHFNKAKAINRQSDIFLYTYSLFLKAAGRTQEAVEILEEAIVIDPVSYISNTYLAEALSANLQFDDAINQLNRTEELFPSRTYTQLLRAWILVHLKKYQQSIDIVSVKIPKSDPMFVEFVALRGLLWGLTGDKERAKKCQARIEEMVDEIPEMRFGYYKICIAFGLGDKQVIKNHLKAASDHQQGGIIMAFSDPFWRSLFNQPWLKDEMALIQSKIKR